MIPNNLSDQAIQNTQEPEITYDSDIPEDAKNLIKQEEHTLKQTLQTLLSLLDRHLHRRNLEESRARELTASLVTARRDEDKQLIASDEAVSHALKEKARDDIKTTNALLNRPYFARVILEEEEENGTTKTIEFKLGIHSNTDARIIDWRRGPLARLYYNYREGEEYGEFIQGRERTGKIKLRNQLDIQNGDLKGIICRYGRLTKTGHSWKQAITQRISRRYDQLPDILSLISPEQFDSITTEANTAVLVQGIAGSGKTSVALHRLSWLLHEGNSPLQPADCAIVVVSRALKEYIKNSLHHLQISGVHTFTLIEWCNECLPCRPLRSDSPLVYARDKLPRTLARLKASDALLASIELIFKTKNQSILTNGFSSDSLDAFEQYINICKLVLECPGELTANDSTKLIDEESINHLKEYLSHQLTQGDIDRYDLALMVRIQQLTAGSIRIPPQDSALGSSSAHVSENKSRFGKYGHLIADEVQDLSAVELAALAGAVPSVRDLTLVGDTAQAITTSHSFPGWTNLMSRWNLTDESSRFILLTISHRSTAPIMRLAQYVSTGSIHLAQQIKGREGRVPIFFQSREESRAIHAAIAWLKKALERYPTAITAVLCRNISEAKQTFSLLRPTFGDTVRLGNDDDCSLEEGLLVAPVGDVKGLEFTNVLVWNPTQSSYSTTDEERNLLYVALTRAEENLALVSWRRPAKHLPQLDSPFVRGISLDADEEEV